VAAILGRHVVVVQRNVVHVNAAVDNPNGVTFLGNDPLHERFLRIERVVEHYDVAAARFADPVDQLVDDEPVLVFECRRHALTFDTSNLKTERHDEDGIDGRRRQGLEPCDELFLYLCEPEPGRWLNGDGSAIELIGQAGVGGRTCGVGVVGLHGGCGRRKRRRVITRGGIILMLAWDALGRAIAYSFRYSRSRRVCVRLTGISVTFASFILRR
jgi:hypothetical protein